MKSKVTSRDEIIAKFQDGQTIAVGGQANHGSPTQLIECLVESGARNLTVIALDSGDPNLTVGRLIHERRVSRIITTHIGKNPETIALYREGKIEVELNPMGTLTERMRCGGMGLGGFLTKTGVGTVLEKEREVVHVNGSDYLMETALRADIALTRCRFADPLGNLSYHGTGFNSNPVFVTAADCSIVEPDCILDLGELSDDIIQTPCPFVDMILGGNK